MRTLTRTAAAGLVVAALALAGCGSDSDGDAASDTTAAEATTTTEAAAELVIDDVWARQSPMGTTMGAIYLTLTSPEDDQLVAAEVPTEVAGTTEIHETVMAEEEGDMSSTTMAEGDMGSEEGDMGSEEGDMESEEGDMGSMTMREVEAIELPAGELVELKPGGYHVMLIDLVAPLEVGDEIELTLTFEKAGDRTVTAEVREG